MHFGREKYCKTCSECFLFNQWGKGIAFLFTINHFSINVRSCWALLLVPLSVIWLCYILWKVFECKEFKRWGRNYFLKFVSRWNSWDLLCTRAEWPQPVKEGGPIFIVLYFWIPPGEEDKTTAQSFSMNECLCF